MIMRPSAVDRRTLLRGAALGAGSLALPGLFPAWATSGTAGVLGTRDTLSGDAITLSVGAVHAMIGGRPEHGFAVNGTIPGPIIRLR